MTALQWIIKEAKILRKKSPKMEWKKAVAQASAIYASKHKGKSPVGKKKAKKVGTVKRKVVRKKAAKRKPTEKSVLKSIKHAVNVQKAHMSGISGHALHNIDKELKQIKHLESLIRSNEIAKKNTKDGKAKKAMSSSIKKYKELMKEHKIHITQLKKHI